MLIYGLLYPSVEASLANPFSPHYPVFLFETAGDGRLGINRNRHEINNGSTFVVSLPVSQKEEMQHDIQTAMIPNN